uniref:Uncharacterized protein n=1 Tax=Arundo donax TaxID=35708 RepID=A0A0A8XSS9_ARUDO
MRPNDIEEASLSECHEGNQGIQELFCIGHSCIIISLPLRLTMWIIVCLSYGVTGYVCVLFCFESCCMSKKKQMFTISLCSLYV